MDHHEIVLSALENSIRQAAKRLEEAAGNTTSADTWQYEVQQATRAAILAVERHLGQLAGDDGLIQELTTEDPRLLGAVERHEAALARLLVEIWNTREEVAVAGEESIERLRWLAGQLRHCANEEIGILYESFNEPPGID